jgi:hypothetical protein
MQFFQNARFHFVGGLIGKRYSQDTTMSPFLMRIEQQMDIVLRKPVCFARSGGGAVNVEHWN